MEEEKTNSKMLLVIPVVIAAVVILGVVGVFTYQKTKIPSQKVSAPTVTPIQTQEPTVRVLKYKDGTYSAVGNYVSPGGPREVDVSVTLKGGVVAESSFQGHATDPNSMRFQGEFKDGYKQFVVGKNIAEIALTKVSGSSLTPIGFNDAIAKIKAKAQV